MQRVPGDGEWRFVVQQRATGPTVDRILTALALPSDPPTDGACGAVFIPPTDVELETTAGGAPQARRVESPVDPCHQPRQEVRDAYAGLEWRTAQATAVEQVRSEAAVASSCVPWKDVIALSTAAKPAPAPAARVEGAVRVCRYSSNGTDGFPLGGRALTGEESLRVATLLSGAPAAEPCALAHAQFAVVRIAADTDAYVEMDGCQRVLNPDGTFSRAPDDLVALLATFRDGGPGLTGRALLVGWS